MTNTDNATGKEQQSPPQEKRWTNRDVKDVTHDWLLRGVTSVMEHHELDDSPSRMDVFLAQRILIRPPSLPLLPSCTQTLFLKSQIRGL
jgi:hypothetical protein